MLAARGVHPDRIQSLGRWLSPLVVRYAGEALATGLADQLRSSAVSHSPAAESSALPELRKFMFRLDRRLEAVEADRAERIRIAATAEAATDTRSEPFVHNPDSEVYHRSLTDGSARPECRQTVCGWFFASRRHSWAADIPTDVRWQQICGICLKPEREFSRQMHGDLSDLD